MNKRDVSRPKPTNKNDDDNRAEVRCEGWSEGVVGMGGGGAGRRDMSSSAFTEGEGWNGSSKKVKKGWDGSSKTFNKGWKNGSLERAVGKVQRRLKRVIRMGR
jgi:hypothetical protein